MPSRQRGLLEIEEELGEKRWVIGKSKDKEGQHEREFKDDGSAGKNGSKRASSSERGGGHSADHREDDKILRLYPTVLRGKGGDRK